MFEKDIKQLIDEMTSFYKDYLPVDSSYALLLDAYIHSYLVLWEEAEYLRKHIALETAPTLKTIRYSKVNIEDALYTKREAVQVRNALTLEEKLKILNRMNKYVTFEFKELGSRNPIVYDMTLKEKFSDEDSLVLYDDYFIRNNRLYLLPEFILRTEHQLDTLHAFNIRIDNMMIEKKWGSFFDIETGPLMPRYKYRDIVSAFRRLLSSNMSIRSFKDAIRLATGWERFDLQDMLTPDLRPGLKKLYDDWMISPSHFIVTLPEELIAEKMQLNVLLSLLDEAKEEHLNYLILFEILRLDKLGHHLSDPVKHNISMKIEDAAPTNEVITTKPMVKQTEFLFPTNRYDVGRRYEVTMYYDYNILMQPGMEMDTREERFTLDGEAVFDIPWKNKPEYAAVRSVNFPEIPRQFKIEKIDTGHLEVSVRSNDDGTEYFELLASPKEYGVYEPVGTFSNDENEGENVFIYDANDSPNRYYKVRAISGLYVSLQTLPINIDDL